MLQTLLFLSRCVVVHEVLVSAEDAGRLHRAASLWAQDALDHDTSAHVERVAVVAQPVLFRNFVYTVASLMDRDIASSAEDNQVFVLVVAVVADGALGVFLDDKATLVGTEGVVALDVEAVWPSIRVISPLFELLQDPLVI